MRPPPALPSRDSAHELSPDTCVRPGQWLALASRQHSSRGVGVTTAPSGVQCSKLCLPGHVGRSASWDSRAFRQRSRRRVPAECRAAFRSASRRAQVGDTGRGRASGPVFAQRGRCPRLCCPTRRETPARFREKAALPPARTRFVLWRLRCRPRLVTPEFGFLSAPVLRNGGAWRATWVDLGTPCWLKCDSVGIDLRPCVRPRKGQRDGGLRLPGPRTDVRGGGRASV